MGRGAGKGFILFPFFLFIFPHIRNFICGTRKMVCSANILSPISLSGYGRVTTYKQF